MGYPGINEIQYHGDEFWNQAFSSFFLDINNGFCSKSHDKWDKVVNHVDQQCFRQHTLMIPDCSETMGTQIEVSNRS